MAPWFRFIAWTTIASVAISATVTTLFAIFQCTPIESNWNPTLPRKCIDVNTMSVATSAVNTTLDVVIIMIPLPELRTLKLHWKKKVGVFVLFLTGGL
jgi:Fungal rhodopsin domain